MSTKKQRKEARTARVSDPTPTTYEEALAAERLILEATEGIIEAMKRRGMSRADLAIRMGSTRANVTQMLDGRNLTLATIARVCLILGVPVHVEVG